MKRTASANASSRSSSAEKPEKVIGYLMCIDNSGYPASLEVGKVYRELPTSGHAPKNWLRVIDESGEDYLFPALRFVRVALPLKGRRALRVAVN